MAYSTSASPHQGKRLPRGPLDILTANFSGGTLAELRVAMTRPILIYYWACSAAVVFSAVLVTAPVAPITVMLIAIGIWASAVSLWQPGTLQTRLTLTVAINSTWMFGLVVASNVHGGAYMLEVHMFYFINTAVILAFACWRAVVLTTVAALFHHMVMSFVEPNAVWQEGALPWVHFGNHAFLGSMNCLGASLIALSLQTVVARSEKLAFNMRLKSTSDSLTGLLNRRGFYEQLADLLEKKPSELVFLVIDLDGFKQINDTAGHAVGDELLQHVGAKLSELTPNNAIVARMGGDEFVIAAPSWLEEDVAVFCDEFLTWTRRACLIKGREVRFGASVGVARGMTDSTDFNELLVDADIALYAAKDYGKNCVKHFDETMRASTLAEKDLTDDVLRGFEAQEFVPFYQTQHDAKTGQLVGVEALARWQHPTRGILPPSAFMHSVEKTGRMAELDELILSKACEDVRRLEDRGHELFELAANVSFSRLHDLELKTALSRLLPMRAKLTFEIVETVILDDMPDEQNRTLDSMRELGIGIAIDDFGTGHASLLALVRISPDKLKIDRQIILSILEAETHQSVLRSILDIAHSLKIQTVAEGVETLSEARLLKEMGVDQLQGFYYSRPMSALELETFLNSSCDTIASRFAEKEAHELSDA